MIKEIVLKNRSYRRFYQEVPISRQELTDWIELARFSPSAANRQPLKFIIVNEPAQNEIVFKTLAWAGYLPDWPGPEEGEKPAAYIIILGDHRISNSFGCDHGIAAQSILLGAVAAGYGGCMLGAVNRPQLTENLKIPEHLEILLVLALGKPKETVVIDTANQDIKYWRDPNQVHHVPKRPLTELIIN